MKSGGSWSRTYGTQKVGLGSDSEKLLPSIMSPLHFNQPT